jgi:hypothetical protein
MLLDNAFILLAYMWGLIAAVGIAGMVVWFGGFVNHHLIRRGL